MGKPAEQQEIMRTYNNQYSSHEENHGVLLLRLAEVTAHDTEPRGLEVASLIKIIPRGSCCIIHGRWIQTYREYVSLIMPREIF